MSSSLPFAFDVDKLNNFINGDLGIADAIHKAQINPILDGIKDPDQKTTFTKVSTPNKETGLWSVEKTFISSALETQKPYIEIIKICLELFGTFEYVIKCLTGGPNPLNDPNSFSGAFKANQADMAKFSTGFEPKPPAPITDPPPPNELFLGYFRRGGISGDVTSFPADPLLYNGKTYNSLATNGQWPQYTIYQDYFDDQLNVVLKPKIASLDQDTQQTIIEGRIDSIGDEWDKMESENQLNKNYSSTTPANIQHYYRTLKLNYSGTEIEIDPEEDYNIKIEKNTYGTLGSDGYYEDFIVSATLKPDASAGSADKKASPDPIPPLPTGILKAIKYFIKHSLGVILEKLIPTIILLEKIISGPVDFLGAILMKKMSEYFEMLDPSLAAKPNTDPTKLKYYTPDGKFVLDGMTVIDAGIFKITVTIKNGLPSFSVGAQSTLPKGNVETPPIKMVSNLVALPINFLKGILDIFKNLLKKIFKIKNLPTVVPDFLTFKDFKDLLGLNALYTALGAKPDESGNVDIKTIPFLNIPKEGNIALVPQQIEAFLKMIIQMINGFIGIPNTIMNVQLVPPLPVP